MRLPWYEHARRDNGRDWPLGDCSKCKATQPQSTRQALGCAFEPPPSNRIPAVPWDHPGRPARSDEPAVCAGYVCSLPEVIEIARAHRHWSNGALRDFCHGDAPDAVLYGIEVFDGACHSFSEWMMKPEGER